MLEKTANDMEDRETEAKDVWKKVNTVCAPEGWHVGV